MLLASDLEKQTVLDLANFKVVIREPAGPAGFENRGDPYCLVFQPCGNTHCAHNLCIQYRDWAAAECGLCQEPLGYDRTFFGYAGASIHSMCLVEAADALDLTV